MGCQYWETKKLEAMDNEALHNVQLVGTDGGKVSCCKAILAAISPVFERMFFGGFQEQDADKCSLHFPSLVLGQVVKYCYCGEVDMNLIFSDNSSLEEQVCHLLKFREAGKYFELEGVSLATEAKIESLVFEENNHSEGNNNKYLYASALLTELFKRNEDMEPLGLAIFEFAVENAVECFGGWGNDESTDTYHAHPTVLANVLRKVLQFPEYRDNCYGVVRSIQTWFALESKSAGNCYSDEEKGPLMEMAESIDLKRLSMKELSELKPSNLFSAERVFPALPHHAKELLESRRIDICEPSFTRPKTVPRLFVAGAGIEILNGSYFLPISRIGGGFHRFPATVFLKPVEHNGESCWAGIHPVRCGGGNAWVRWLISITKSQSECRENHSFQNCVQETIYESQPTRALGMMPPFSGGRWRDTGGTGTGPFVACIKQADYHGCHCERFVWPFGGEDAGN